MSKGGDSLERSLASTLNGTDGLVKSVVSSGFPAFLADERGGYRLLTTSADPLKDAPGPRFLKQLKYYTDQRFGANAANQAPTFAHLTVEATKEDRAAIEAVEQREAAKKFLMWFERKWPWNDPANRRLMEEKMPTLFNAIRDDIGKKEEIRKRMAIITSIGPDTMEDFRLLYEWETNADFRAMVTSNPLTTVRASATNIDLANDRAMNPVWQRAMDVRQGFAAGNVLLPSVPLDRDMLHTWGDNEPAFNLQSNAPPVVDAGNRSDVPGLRGIGTSYADGAAAGSGYTGADAWHMPRH